MFVERFEISRDAFDHPRIGNRADPLRRRLRLLEQLVHGFVIDRIDRRPAGRHFGGLVVASTIRRPGSRPIRRRQRSAPRAWRRSRCRAYHRSAIAANAAPRCNPLDCDDSKRGIAEPPDADASRSRTTRQPLCRKERTRQTTAARPDRAARVSSPPTRTPPPGCDSSSRGSDPCEPASRFSYRHDGPCRPRQKPTDRSTAARPSRTAEHQQPRPNQTSRATTYRHPTFYAVRREPMLIALLVTKHSPRIRTIRIFTHNFCRPLKRKRRFASLGRPFRKIEERIGVLVASISRARH